jgi:hypothetical protein
MVNGRLSPTWLADEAASHAQEERHDQVRLARERLFAAEHDYARAETELIQARRAYREIAQAGAYRAALNKEGG